MKSLLKGFKKSEVAIYAIAIMLVAAGYLNYTTMNGENYVETASINSTNQTEDDSGIGDAELVSSEAITEENLSQVAENTEETEQETDEEQATENSEQDAENGNDLEKDEETVETSSEENDYFASSKLERDTNYASMISNYTAILEKDSVSETEKSVAMNEITNINNIKNAIMICENLLSTKGFENSVVFVNDESVNVVVQIDEGLTTEKVAQIQNIVSRELDVEISNIHITEK